jgi:hypothetical protein
MEKHPPPRIARFLVWASARKEMREDILTAFDEMHHRTSEEFGAVYAYLYSLLQAVRSVPYGVASIIVKLVGLFMRIGG